jgi:hypothetical protein
VGEKRGLYRILWKDLVEGDHLEDRGVDLGGRRNRIKKKLDGEGIDWDNPAQDTEGRWALVNAVMNVRVP